MDIVEPDDVGEVFEAIVVDEADGVTPALPAVNNALPPNHQTIMPPPQSGGNTQKRVPKRPREEESLADEPQPKKFKSDGIPQVCPYCLDVYESNEARDQHMLLHQRHELHPGRNDRQKLITAEWERTQSFGAVQRLAATFPPQKPKEVQLEPPHLDQSSKSSIPEKGAPPENPPPIQRNSIPLPKANNANPNPSNDRKEAVHGKELIGKQLEKVKSSIVSDPPSLEVQHRMFRPRTPPQVSHGIPIEKPKNGNPLKTPAPIQANPIPLPMATEEIPNPSERITVGKGPEKVKTSIVSEVKAPQRMLRSRIVPVPPQLSPNIPIEPPRRGNPPKAPVPLQTNPAPLPNSKEQSLIPSEKIRDNNGNGLTKKAATVEDPLPKLIGPLKRTREIDGFASELQGALKKVKYKDPPSEKTEDATKSDPKEPINEDVARIEGGVKPTTAPEAKAPQRVLRPIFTFKAPQSDAKSESASKCVIELSDSSHDEIAQTPLNPLPNVERIVPDESDNLVIKPLANDPDKLVIKPLDEAFPNAPKDVVLNFDSFAPTIESISDLKLKRSESPHKPYIMSLPRPIAQPASHTKRSSIANPIQLTTLSITPQNAQHAPPFKMPPPPKIPPGLIRKPPTINISISNIPPSTITGSISNSIMPGLPETMKESGCRCPIPKCGMFFVNQAFFQKHMTNVHGNHTDANANDDGKLHPELGSEKPRAEPDSTLGSSGVKVPHAAVKVVDHKSVVENDTRRIKNRLGEKVSTIKDAKKEESCDGGEVFSSDIDDE